MFPSLDTNGYDNLFDPFNPHQTTMLPSFATHHHIQSPNSSHHHNNPSHSFPFSQDFLDESFLISQFLLQQQNQEEAEAEAANVVVESPRKVHKKRQQKEKCVDDGTTPDKIPRRRMGKRDRHSKICTAQGPRDRRMRLSLQIARKFFDLQDMLGFDKASKTIEWLFSKSKASIKQVKENVAASGGGGDYEHLQVNEKAKDETLKVRDSKRRAKTVETSCKAKESRERARKRARERTMTKMKMRLSDPPEETTKIKIAGGGQAEGSNQEQEWSTTNANTVEINQMDSVSIIEKFLGLTNESSFSSISLSSSRGSTSTTGRSHLIDLPITPREHNITSTESVDEERNPNSSFSLYDYLCY